MLPFSLILLLVFVTFSILFFTIYVYFNNNSLKGKISYLNAYSLANSGQTFKNISLSFNKSSRYKTTIYPFSSCDVYLFENFLVLARHNSFILKFMAEPIVIVNSSNFNKVSISNFKVFVPTKMAFNKFKKNELEIVITTHLEEKYHLKHLTKNQTESFEKLLNKNET